MEQVKLHGFWASPYSRRIEWALKLKGIAYEYVEEDLQKKSKELLRFNPVHKKVPVLVHRGKPIVESIIILEYIEEIWRDVPLLPKDPYQRAKARFWAHFVDNAITLKIIRTAGEEQKAARDELVEKLQSSESDSSSPTDFLSSRSSRKTLIYLVLTLSHMYPDYDFRPVQAHHLFRDEEWDGFKQIFDTYLFEAAKEWSLANDGCSLFDSISKAIDEVVKLAECEIYSFNPDTEEDPFVEKGAIWSFHFFFYNRKLKRVVSFRCCCLSNLAADGFLVDHEIIGEDDDGDIFNEMDM